MIEQLGRPKTVISNKRFVVLGGPSGYLTVLPLGHPWLAPDSTHYTRCWQRLFTVNRPYSFSLAEAAKTAALRCYEVRS